MAHYDESKGHYEDIDIQHNGKILHCMEWINPHDIKGICKCCGKKIEPYSERYIARQCNEYVVYSYRSNFCKSCAIYKCRINARPQIVQVYHGRFGDDYKFSNGDIEETTGGYF